jgi:hypothetical protein
MKRLMLLAMLLLGATQGVWAQTETPTPTATPTLIPYGSHPFNFCQGMRDGFTQVVGGGGNCDNWLLIQTNGYYRMQFTGLGFWLQVYTYSGITDDVQVCLDDECTVLAVEGTASYQDYIVMADEYGLHRVEFTKAGTKTQAIALAEAVFFDHETVSGSGTGEQIEITPDGATYYATVVFDETSQTVAVRYQVDAGQVMIVIMLAVIAALLLVMFVASLRRGAPEP